MVSTKSIADAIGTIPAKKESLRKAYDELRSLSSTLSSFTLQWDDIESHLASISESIELRFKELESKEKSLAAKPSPSVDPKPEETEAVPRSELKEFCVRMDGKGLRAFVNENRKDLASLRGEISPALKLAPDPARLILGAMEGFYPSKSKVGNGGGGSNTRDGELHANRRTCILLLERLHAISPDVPQDVRENAKRIAVEWKGKILDVAENSVEAWAFLQLLATFGLSSEFDIDEVLAVIIPIARRKPTIDVCKVMGIDDKIPDLIEKLNNKGKHLDAVKFAYAFDLVEKFPPVPLLKAYLKECKNAAQEVRKKGNNSAQSRNEATAKELSAYKAVIKAIEEYKLESEYSTENLKKQVSRLEQMKVEKKRTATTASIPNMKSQQLHAQKRARPETSSAAALAAAYPIAPLSQTQPQLSLADRASYFSSVGQYGLAGAGSVYDHGASSLLGPPVANRSPPKSYLYASDSHAGSVLYDRPGAYDSRPVAYDTRAVSYDTRPVSYDNRTVAYDNVAAAYDNRAAAYGGYNLSSGLPPQYSHPQLP